MNSSRQHFIACIALWFGLCIIAAYEENVGVEQHTDSKSTEVDSSTSNADVREKARRFDHIGILCFS